MANGQRIGIETKTRTKTKRLNSVSRQNGHMSSKKEAILRMHHGITVKEEAILPVHASHGPLYEQLLEIELRAFEATGRMAEMLELTPDIETQTQNAKSLEIIRKLKKR